jgi:hypothetical protein
MLNFWVLNLLSDVIVLFTRCMLTIVQTNIALQVHHIGKGTHVVGS